MVLGASPLAWPLLGTAIGLGAGQSTGRDHTSVGAVATLMVVMAALGVGHTASLVFVSWLAVDAWTPPGRLLRGMQTAGAVLLLLAAGWFVRQAILGGVTVGTRLP